MLPERRQQLNGPTQQRPARIDDAADIRDKAAALAAYARQRDDNDMECWVREIHLRACVRIGELVRELDTATAGRPSGNECEQPHQFSKAEAIADAGIPKRTAYDYQALAGGRDERAQAAGKAASENYYAQSRAKSEPPTMAGVCKTRSRVARQGGFVG